MSSILPTEEAQPRSVTNSRGPGHKGTKFWAPDRTEKIARDCEPHISLKLAVQTPENEVRDREKQIEKRQAIEEHLGMPNSRVSHTFLLTHKPACKTRCPTWLSHSLSV